MVNKVHKLLTMHHSCVFGGTNEIRINNENKNTLICEFLRSTVHVKKDKETPREFRYSVGSVYLVYI